MQDSPARDTGRSWPQELDTWAPVGCMQQRVRQHLSTLERCFPMTILMIRRLCVRLVCSHGCFNDSVVQWSVGVSSCRAQLAARQGCCIKWHIDTDFPLDSSAVNNLLLQPSWIQHLVIERGTVNTERPSVSPLRSQHS